MWPFHLPTTRHAWKCRTNQVVESLSFLFFKYLEIKWLGLFNLIILVTFTKKTHSFSTSRFYQTKKLKIRFGTCYLEFVLILVLRLIRRHFEWDGKTKKSEDLWMEREREHVYLSADWGVVSENAFGSSLCWFNTDDDRWSLNGLCWRPR